MTTAKEFRDFFASIPEEKWTCGDLNVDGKCCALGHLDSQYFHMSEDAKRFGRLLDSHFKTECGGKDDRIIWMLNDGLWGPLMKTDDGPYSPKANVLAALDQIIHAHQLSTEQSTEGKM